MNIDELETIIVLTNKYCSNQKAASMDLRKTGIKKLITRKSGTLIAFQ